MAQREQPGFVNVGTHGVRVRGTSLWCDVARAGGTCFVSRADVVLGRGRADRYIATSLTAALCVKLGRALDEPLLPRYARPFALGKARLELLPSGRSEGAAQLLVELDGWRGLYAGSVWPGTSGETAQVRACDELVIDAPDRSHPGGIVDDDEAIERALVRGGRVDDLAVLAELQRRFGARLRLGGAWRSLGKHGKGDLRVESARGIPVVAGRRTDEGKVALGLGPTLDAWLVLVRDTGASKVWVRGQGAEPAIDALRARGLEAQQLGPAVQLSLFAAPRFKVAR